jgi:hypothetical protein
LIALYQAPLCEEGNPKQRIEDPCSKLQGIFDRKECGLFMIRSLTPPQATGNALAFAVQNRLEVVS